MVKRIYKIYRRSPGPSRWAFSINIPREIAESFDEDARFVCERVDNLLVFRQVKIEEVA